MRLALKLRSDAVNQFQVNHRPAISVIAKTYRYLPFINSHTTPVLVPRLFVAFWAGIRILQSYFREVRFFPFMVLLSLAVS